MWAGEGGEMLREMARHGEEVARWQAREAGGDVGGTVRVESLAGEEKEKGRETVGSVRVDGRDDMGSRMDLGKHSMKSVMDIGKHSMKSVMDRW